MEQQCKAQDDNLSPAFRLLVLLPLYTVLAAILTFIDVQWLPGRKLGGRLLNRQLGLLSARSSPPRTQIKEELTEPLAHVPHRLCRRRSRRMRLLLLLLMGVRVRSSAFDIFRSFGVVPVLRERRCVCPQRRSSGRSRRWGRRRGARVRRKPGRLEGQR